MASSSCNVTLSLKLLIDTEKKKVLFAETGKDFVGFLFHLLTLPIGTVTRLLAGKRMDGCLVNLHGSVKCFSDHYIQPNLDKRILLNPNVPAATAEVPFLLADADEVSPPKTLYMCESHHQYFSDNMRAICPQCHKHLNTPMSYGYGDGGFVKGMMTYMIMDDLVVKPMSIISGITLLNKFNVSNVEALKEHMVTFGIDEAMKLLKPSLEMKAVLTNVFLSNMEI